MADMTEDERARIRASSRPPPKSPPVLPYPNPRGRDDSNETAEVTMVCRRHVTELAVLYRLRQGGGASVDVWVPKSVIVDVDFDNPHESGDWGAVDAPVRVAIKRWWARREGMAE